MSRTELGRVVGLEAKGAHLAANRLLEEGVLRLVGRGSRQQVELNPEHPLAEDIRTLFHAERALVTNLIAALKRVVQAQGPDLAGAWIQGPFARGVDRPGEPIQLGVLGHSRTINRTLERLRSLLAVVEQEFDTTVDVFGYTAPDLAVARRAERKELSRTIQLYGLPPLAEDADSPKLRDRVTHRIRDRDLLRVARLIAERLPKDPARRRAARDFVVRRMATASAHERPGLEEWLTILDTMSTARLGRFLTDTGERATRLRQTLPFLDVLSPEERRALLREARVS